MPIQTLTHQATTWLNVVHPSQVDIAALHEAYPFLTPLNLEDITSGIERPKIDREDEYLFVILQVPRWDERLRLTRPYEVDLIVGRDFVITAHDGRLKPLDRLYAAAAEESAEAAALLEQGAIHAFYLIVDRLIDYIFPILRKVDMNIRTLEERIFSSDTRAIIREIAILRRDIIAIQRIIRQLSPVIEVLDISLRRVFRDDDLTDYFDDLVDHIHRARDIIDEDSDVVAALGDTADKLLSHRLNNIIRVLTVFSVIMLPLTLISSIYGMNVALPLQEHPQSFALISVSMIVIALVMLAYFRLRRWL
jgi:magnesium transporter